MLVPSILNLLLGIVLESVTKLKVLGIILDTILSFIRKDSLCFGEQVLVLRCFWSYQLSVLE